MISKVLLAMLLLVSPAFGQLRAVTGDAKHESIVTNGELTPERQFHMLIIHDNNAAAGQLLQMVQRPQSKEMQSWAAAIEVRPMAANESFVTEHHEDLVQKWQGQLPIIALVDRTGGVWWSAGAGQIPSAEKQLATVLNTAYSKTLEAARQSQSGPILPPAVQSSPLANQRVSNPSGGSYFLQRGGVSAPEGYRSYPVTNYQVSSNDLSDTVDSNTLPYVICGVLILCTCLLAASPVISAMIIGAAITEDDQEKA